jgi:uncharacterized protein YndB with AHSA1/START domain
MTIETAGTSVQVSVLVDAPVEHAFKVFTEGMDTWWPREHHLLEGEYRDAVFEPRTGGHIYHRDTVGGVSRWARVLVYDPPTRLVFTWDISPQWHLETDLSRTSEVEVTFSAESPGRTRVELEHRHLDRHGDGWEPLRDAVGGPGGWTSTLEAFASAAGA